MGNSSKGVVPKIPRFYDSFSKNDEITVLAEKIDDITILAKKIDDITILAKKTDDITILAEKNDDITILAPPPLGGPLLGHSL